MDRILLVEDDKNLSFITKRLLESRGYEVMNAQTIAQAQELLRQHSYDLILLDLMLPDGDGGQLCEDIRKTSVCPIIFVSCLSDSLTKIAALQMGGDDYITKPVDHEELIARIQVNIRRARQYNLGKSEREEMFFPGLMLKKQKREVWLTNEENEPLELVDLSPIEYALLLCLIENEGELVLYQDIFHQVWHAEDLGDVRTLMVHISNLRKKLGDRGKLIHTVCSAGYIFKR